MRITKNIIIDIQCLKITSLNLNHILTLLKIKFYDDKSLLNYKVNKDDLLYLVDKKYLIESNNKSTIRKYFLRQKGKIALSKIIKIETTKNEEKLLIKDISIKDQIEDFNILITKYRTKFKDLKVGSMGNNKAVRDKLKRWMKDNPDVTQKEILNAVDTYLESLNGDYRYLQRADYFIYKQNLRKEEVSRLSLFIEENRKEVVNSDWTTTLT